MNTIRPDLVALGQRIRDRRLAAGMTLREMAEAVGIDFTYVSKIENARMEYPPAAVTLRTMADVLGDDPDVLLDLSDQHTKAELRAEIERLRARIAELEAER